VIVPYLLDWHIPAQEAFIFDVLVQLGTLLAVIVYFWKDLYRIIVAVISGLLHRQPFSDTMSRLGWYLVLATIPAVIAGLLFKNLVEAAFASPVAAALFLFGTAALLVIAERVGKRSHQFDSITGKDALVVGLFQVISLLPGISRSGSTISGGMIRNLDRPSAARFSFLMSVPVMLGAGAVAVFDLIKLPSFSILGYFTIRWLLSYLARRPLYLFIIYCTVAPTIVVIFSLINS
jgi:undecaprenyl-diphosphatase